MNVLVVDDDKDLLEMVSLVLRKHDMTVACLHEGANLFQKLSLSQPDIILMDIYLGDSDGRELCRQLKESSEYKHLPVILYSAGNITLASIQESLANDFIAKPFDISSLVKKITSQNDRQQ